MKMTLEDGEGRVSKERLQLVEKDIGIKFPISFVDLLQDEDGGYPAEEFADFLYYDSYSKAYFVTGIGAFLSIGDSKNANVLDYYKSPPEMFPKDVVIFADTGGGDYFCFDYRYGYNNQNPPIVYWNHEAEVGKDLIFLAPDFDIFIKMFKPEGYYDHLLGGSSGE